jgi:hypothetical protein
MRTHGRVAGWTGAIAAQLQTGHSLLCKRDRIRMNSEPKAAFMDGASV